MNRHVLVLGAVVSSAALVLAGCGGAASSGGGAGDPYRVLVTGGLSAQGVLATNSKTSVISAQASADEINKTGGIAGRRIEVTVVDDGGDPTTAVTKLREAIAKRKPDLYLNSGPSVIASATLPILQQNKILSFNIGPTNESADPGKFPLNFDLSPSPTDYAKGFIAHAKEKGYQKIGILYGSTSYGASFVREMHQALTAAGLQVVGEQQFDAKALDMTPQLQNLRGSSPDAIAMTAYGAPVGYVLKSLAKIGWTVPVLGDTAVSATSLVSTPPPDGVLGTDQVANLMMEVFDSTVYDPADTSVNTAVAAMKAKAEGGVIPSTLINAYNYDALALVAAAAADVGKADDPSAIAKAIEKPEVLARAKTAILHDYHYSATSHSPNATADAFVFIKPSRLDSGQFRP
ncbi:ABC transporter substrate-binding protein [Amycolatopsis granulosa]|uniref:ABC transporter substrate-binding protein n=1 Tax=Amycolatopsis granulosa TaxID=185684 RepID=UPI0014220737|nr:ABC transporter substrate-binding protein [Amycolatopsis granulosa]NIH83886.1 branched-chain amino acid transport system substrate-binding protein [Amycolatopsis granulosa]